MDAMNLALKKKMMDLKAKHSDIYNKHEGDPEDKHMHSPEIEVLESGDSDDPSKPEDMAPERNAKPGQNLIEGNNRDQSDGNPIDGKPSSVAGSSGDPMSPHGGGHLAALKAMAGRAGHAGRGANSLAERVADNAKEKLAAMKMKGKV